MDANHITAVLITAILLWAGSTLAGKWMNVRKDVRLAELNHQKETASTKAQIATLATIDSVNRAELKKWEILERVLSIVPTVRPIAREADKGRAELFRHVTGEGATINGVYVPAKVGKLIANNGRVPAEDVRLDGVYRIFKVDTTVATGLRVHLSATDGREFAAEVADVMTTVKDRELIQDAEWSKVPIYLEM